MFKKNDVVRFNKLGKETYGYSPTFSTNINNEFSVLGIFKAGVDNDLDFISIDFGGGKSYGMNHIYFEYGEVHFRNDKLNKIMGIKKED